MRTCGFIPLAEWPRGGIAGSHGPETLGVCLSLILAVQVPVRWPRRALTWAFPMISEIEHFFMCSRAICILTFAKCRQVFGPFFCWVDWLFLISLWVSFIYSGHEFPPDHF